MLRHSLRFGQDCTPDYRITDVPIWRRNVTIDAAIDVLALFLGRSRDLVLAKVDSALERISRRTIRYTLGVCVRRHDEEEEMRVTVIAAIGKKSDIRGWPRQAEGGAPPGRPRGCCWRSIIRTLMASSFTETGIYLQGKERRKGGIRSARTHRRHLHKVERERERRREISVQ